MKRLIVGGFMAVLLLGGANPAAAASFDCAKAVTRQEKLICGDPQLSAADEALARIYREALESAADREGLKRQQQEWIKAERNAGQDAAAMRNAYKARIAALEGHMQKISQEVLREADERFTFQGKPINPRMLNDLLPWLADTLPGPVAVDLAGGGNRYFAEITVHPKGVVRAVWEEEKEQRSCQYQHLGRLANGMHVVKSSANSGGSGTFMDLLLVKFLVDAEYGDGGLLRKRLLMMRAGAFSLGAGYNGAITVQPNQISIGPGGSGIRQNATTEVASFK